MFGGGRKKTKREEFSMGGEAIKTLIGEGCLFEGNLSIASGTKIEGTIKGNIKGHGLVIIGESGRVEGDVESDEVVIYGQVIGNVKCKRLELKKGAVLEGDIQTEILVIEEGAKYEGKCTMTAEEESKLGLESTP